MVSDYAAGAEGAWTDMRKSLAALAAQDLEEPAEFILCESEEFREELPGELTEILPALRILFVPGRSSYELKNAAVKAASSEFIAMIDADCVPGPEWLRLLLDSLRRHPDAAAVSGKTMYGDKSFFVRTSMLLSRAYLDPGGDGPTRFIAENNAGYRRSAYLAHPMPTHMGGFAGHVQSAELLRHGYTLWFDPAFVVEHDFEGWPMEKDIRRNLGHSAIKTRMLDRSLPYAWLVRLGPIGIAPMLAREILCSWWDCIRCGRSYGVRWYELPVVMVASVGINLLELPGMVAAFRGGELGKTEFR